MPTTTVYPRGARPMRVMGVGGNTNDGNRPVFRRGSSPRGQSRGADVIRSVRGNNRYRISGVTRNGTTNAAIAGKFVYLFETTNYTLVAQTVSDGGGNYSFDVPNDATLYFVADFQDSGTPMSGITLRNVRGVLVP